MKKIIHIIKVLFVKTFSKKITEDYFIDNIHISLDYARRLKWRTSVEEMFTGLETEIEDKWNQMDEDYWGGPFPYLRLDDDNDPLVLSKNRLQKMVNTLKYTRPPWVFKVKEKFGIEEILMSFHAKDAVWLLNL